METLAFFVSSPFRPAPAPRGPACQCIAIFCCSRSCGFVACCCLLQPIPALAPNVAADFGNLDFHAGLFLGLQRKRDLHEGPKSQSPKPLQNRKSESHVYVNRLDCGFVSLGLIR
jgi:hypothetical protein